MVRFCQFYSETIIFVSNSGLRKKLISLKYGKKYQKSTKILESVNLNQTETESVSLEPVPNVAVTIIKHFACEGEFPSSGKF